MSAPLRVVAITHRTPFPPDKGDKIRTHHLLTRLAARCEVHLVAFAEPASDLQHLARLRRHFASVTLVPLDLRWQKLRALPWLLTTRPLTVPVFAHGALSRAVADLVAGVKPSVFFAESSSMAPYALAHPEVPLVMDFVDVDSAKWAAYAEKARGPERLVFAREAATLARFERKVAGHARVSLVTADREKVLLDAIAPGVTTEALPNGVDTEYFAAGRPWPEAPSVVFFGAMDYEANVEAAVFLVERVLPRLRAVHPDVRVVLAGSRPAPAVEALKAVAGVTVTGYVDDMRPWVKGARVCVVPLRVARGVQNKVLEAMAMGVPVVCSPAAAEGIDAGPAEALTVAAVDDDGRAFADATLGLLDDPARAQSLADVARAVVETRYGWQPRAERLEALLRGAAR
ncbi:MAG: TIGR03087 family PEP-CTERM/XrtA system glycosyltransferase [Myxococcales bacterium]|nr:TIGR03087 family PEP-CTERM/XrtA system glycosyltransferase [Myxococcales bacterium]